MHARGAPLLAGSITATGAKVSRSSNEPAALRSPAGAVDHDHVTSVAGGGGGGGLKRVKAFLKKCDLLLLCGCWVGYRPAVATSWNGDVMVPVFTERKYRTAQNYALRRSFNLDFESRYDIRNDSFCSHKGRPLVPVIGCSLPPWRTFSEFLY